MTDARSRRRFCSCSEVPPHLDRMPLSELGDAPETAGEPLEAAGGALGSEEVGGGEANRFCTCSDVPPRIASRSTTVSASRRKSEDSEETPLSAGETPSEPLRAAAFASEPGRGSLTNDDLVLASVSDLLPGEKSVCSAFTHGEGGTEVVLTERRVLLRGAPDAATLHASMRLNEIDSVVLKRARPRRRSLIWGLIGIGASIAMWQALDGVGNLRLIIVAVVMLMSCLLLADYFLRPPELDVVLRARSGAEMRVAFAPANAGEADRFAARVISKLGVAA